MLLRVIVEQPALFLIAVAASVKVQLPARGSRAGAASTEATRPLRRTVEENMLMNGLLKEWKFRESVYTN
jgi:hypothetical protein